MYYAGHESIIPWLCSMNSLSFLFDQVVLSNICRSYDFCLLPSNYLKSTIFFVLDFVQKWDRKVFNVLARVPKWNRKLITKIKHYFFLVKKYTYTYIIILVFKTLTFLDGKMLMYFFWETCMMNFNSTLIRTVN